MKKLNLLIAAILMIASMSLTAQVTINTDGSQPDGSAMLDVKSTDKGFLPPRMTEAQRDAISSAAAGLMVWCTNCGVSGELQIYNGTEWTNLIGGAASPVPNLAPVASNVSYSGTMEVGETLTGSYTYSDTESDAEGASTFKWYRADDATGTNQAAISGATALTYDLVSADDAKYISFEVTPVAITGTSPGAAVMSDYDGPVTTPVLAIGDFYQGGVIFYFDGIGGGLICAVSDQSAGEWGCSGTEINGADGSAIGAGALNTIDIEIGCPTYGIAADICANLSLNGYNDWFLPSKGELNEMYQNRFAINITAGENGGSSFASDYYWSSTEFNSDYAWGQSFSFTGDQNGNFKHNTRRVRAVRAF